MAAVLEYGEKAPGEKNKWVVFLLCLLFGWLGVHRFYEKKIVTGIFYLLTMGFCGIGVIIDLLSIVRR
ncbi:MAG: TM2 domain-containing protein [Clostridia bacterium]|nr:TM2 domain-containing protein [Clostridia bacterium]